MTGMTRPRGPLPARVYWVRRTVVLVVALGLVFGIAQLLARSDGSDDEVARVVGSTPRPAASAGARSTADAAAQPHRHRTDRARRDRRAARDSRPVRAVPDGPCRSDEIVVTPKLREPAHAGSTVHFRLKVTTTGRPACTWTVSPETMVVKIASGADRIWSSQDCPDAVPATDVVARKDVPAKVDMGWRGQRSDSECTRQPPWALPGFYHVQAAAFGAEPTDVQFELEPAVVPTKTATPKPEKPKRQDKRRGDDDRVGGRDSRADEQRNGSRDAGRDGRRDAGRDTGGDSPRKADR